MKKLLTTLSVVGAISLGACQTKQVEIPTPAPPPPTPIPYVTEMPKTSSITLDTLDKRVTDIETRMAKARAYWAKHRK